jgi:carbamoyl-phosphate synthase large subunit
MKQNILFTCAGRRNYLINYFKKALNGNGIVVATDYLLNAPALIDADFGIKVPNIYDDNYIPRLKEIIKEYDINAVISLNDLELPILSKYKHELESPQTKVLISDKNVIDIGFDKWKTYHFLKKIGLNTPKTFLNLNEAIKAIKDGKLKFPIVLKPRWGSSSKEIEFPESIKELKLAYELQKIKLSRTTLNSLSNNNFEDIILIQEYIDGQELGLDIVNNFKGEYFGVFAKKKLHMRSGETDKAQTIINENIEKLSKKIAKELKHLGIMDTDAFLINDQLFILEFNPRFGGGYAFSHEAGANIASVYFDWLNGYTNDDVLKHIDYKADITYSKCDRLLQV